MDKGCIAHVIWLALMMVIKNSCVPVSFPAYMQEQKKITQPPSRKLLFRLEFSIQCWNLFHWSFALTLHHEITVVLAWCAYLESPCWMTVLAHVPKEMFVSRECWDERKNYLEKEICLWALQVSGQKWKSDTTIKKISFVEAVLSQLGFFLKLKIKICDPRARMYNTSTSLPTKTKLAHFAAITKGGNTLSQALSNSWAQSQLGNSV